MSPKTVTAADVKRYLIEDEGWTAAEVNEFLEALNKSTTRTLPTTYDEWDFTVNEFNVNGTL